MEDGPRRYGFYTTRWVRAKRPEEAELKCLKKLKLQGELGAKHPDDETDLAKIYFDEVIEMPKLHFAKFGKGFSFFPMDETDTQP